MHSRFRSDQKKTFLETGKTSEDRVAAEAVTRGYHLLARNIRYPFGELDLIVESPDRRFLVFIEVRSRADARPGIDPLETVTFPKQLKLKRAAQAWLRTYSGQAREMRFDVVTVKAGKITWVAGAFA